MDTIEFEVKLFDTTSYAADGSNIPRTSCEQYLQSEDYRSIIRDKTSIGGVSHKDRRLQPELKGLVGMDDQVLINDNATHYITKLYFRDGSNFFYARARTFNPDLFAGRRRDNIINLMGLLETGVRMPVSVVIQALWSRRGVAEKIIKIKGFDFTQNPSFKGAGDIRIYSDVKEDTDALPSEIVKQYSEQISSGDLELKTVIYSSLGEVEVISGGDDTGGLIDPTQSVPSFDRLYSKGTITYRDVVFTYGQASEQARLFTDLKIDKVGDEELRKIVTDVATGERNVRSMDDEGQRVLNRKMPGAYDRLRILESFNGGNAVDTDDELDHKINQISQVYPNQSYSSVDAIASRMLNDQQPRLTKIDRIIRSYKHYVQQRPDGLDDSKALRLKLMFLQDLNLLLKDVLPEIRKGKTFTSLYGLTRYGDDVVSAANQLSDTYRKLIISEAIMKFVPKGIYGEWLVDIKAFYNAMTVLVFGSELTDTQFNLIDLKQ